MMQPPKEAAVINPISNKAFSVRFDKRDDKTCVFDFDSGSSMDLGPFSYCVLSQTLALRPSDTMLFVAPYVKVMTPLKQEWAAQLMKARLTFSIDGEKVVNNEPIEPYLVTPPCELARDPSGGSRC
jgi:hypothetical protein